MNGPPLHVPERAILDFEEVLGLLEQHGGAAAALHVIAAPIVAAELRRLSDLYRRLGDFNRRLYREPGWRDGDDYRFVAADLLARAEELEAT